jgi:hypothetical protein
MDEFGTMGRIQIVADRISIMAGFGVCCMAIVQSLSQPRASGPPKYRLDYMIRHGMGAFTGEYGDGLVPDFDSSSGWKQVRMSYLECAAASPAKNP